MVRRIAVLAGSLIVAIACGPVSRYGGSVRENRVWQSALLGHCE